MMKANDPRPASNSNQPMHLGVCYYPEHWPEDRWAADAAAMAAMGLSRVRIGEFAWSRIEPEPGRYDWGWLDRAVETLSDAGLGIIMGTPTATPPKWLVDAMPDMIARDRQGRLRTFGSRRHYCFSHEGYAREAERISAAVAERYGAHPAIVMWQTDNEYGCHDTVLSYSEAARDGFRRWLAAKYGSAAALNAAWGNVFWSMEVRDFGEVELPHLTTTEANPAHWLDFRRYSSDAVIAWNRRMMAAIRAHAATTDITHNVMGFVTEFDHHALGADLDLTTWDSYPLGFLEQFPFFSEEEKRAYARQGHPDIAAFHHDLYRGCSGGRWGVMEQQPGPVNWARYNPAPLPGMVRLWTLEAFAHGAELVSYFRWRQAPFAQEQMHAGLHRPDGSEAPGANEVRAAAADLAAIGDGGNAPKSVALIFDYEGEWVTATQPHGGGLSALRTAFDWYRAARALGLDIDVVGPDASLDGYGLILIPCLPIVSEALVTRLEGTACPIVIGPRSGSKTADFAIPGTLPPGTLGRLFPARVLHVESLRPGLAHAGDGWAVTGWIETVETGAEAEHICADGRVAVWRQGRVRYCSGLPDAVLADRVIASAAIEGGLHPVAMPEGMRVRRRGGRSFVVNYAAEVQAVPAGIGGEALVGARMMPAAGVSVFG